MKILISSLGRSGSKILQQNTQTYLVAKYGQDNVLTAEKVVASGFNVKALGLGAFFDIGAYNGGIKSILPESYENGVLQNDPLLDVNAELVKRTKLVKTTDKHLVVQDRWTQKRIKNELILAGIESSFDRQIVIHRNLRDWVLSAALEVLTGTTSKNVYQEKAILNAIANKLHVERSLVEDLIRQHKAFEAKSWSESAIHVDFDQIVNATNSEQLCALIGCEFFPITIRTNVVEFGQNKERMIENLEEVLQIIQENI